MSEELELVEKEEVKSATVVTIRPIPKAGKRLGLSDQPENFMRMPGTKYTWVPSRRGNTYLTGLTKEEEQIYGNKLGYDLSNKSDFWMNLRFELKEVPLGIKLNLNNAREYVVYKAMTASELIATSLQEQKTGDKPSAEWYIENLEAEAEEKAKMADLKLEAYKQYSNISDDRKMSLAKILGLKPQGLTKKAAAAKLFDFLEDKKQGLVNIKSFLRSVELKDGEIAVGALFEDAVAYNIIKMNKAKDFVYGDFIFGSKGQAIAKLISPDNQDIRHKVTELVEAKQK